MEMGSASLVADAEIGEVNPMDIEQLRKEAKRCYRLARTIKDEQTIELLLRMGADLEDRARILEKEAKAAGKTNNA